ncbi:MAG: cytochrome c oxidase subunit II [Polyangiaceae bacterium]|nr:cytochrome c oxidase subunit II [Polyangiaceae bacterium]
MLASLPASAQGHGTAMPSDYMPPEFQQVGIKEHLGDRLPLELTLRDEGGAEVKLGDYFKQGRPVVLNFVYHTCPMLCGMVLSGFTASAREHSWTIGKDYDVISISIDPKDTPQLASEKKAHWVKVYGRDEAVTGRGWHFLTGDALAIKRATEAVGFSYYYDARQKQYAHAAAMFLATPDGKLARYLYGIEFPAKDFRFGLAEAAEGRGGSTLDHLLLYCYQYDPTSRGYVLVAWKVMRLGALATVIAVASMLGVLWARERRRLPNAGGGAPGAPGAPETLQPNPEGLVTMDLIASLFLPQARSPYASSVDGLFVFLVVMSVIMFVLITGAAGYWTMKYKRKEGDEKKLSKPTMHNISIEIFWSVGPLLFCIGLFHVGAKQYMDARVAPGDSYVINVAGRKWAWEFTYPNGKVSSDMHVPIGKPVKLVMNSQDVIHSFFIPDFRVKQDVLPGRYSTIWFKAEQPGTSVVYCTEYCGMSHSDMLSKVVAEEPAEFQKWVDFDPYGDPALSLAQVGEKLYADKACVGCHSLDGTVKPGGGPSFKGLWGKTETFADGSTALVDENYLRESILVPGAKIVKGYQPVMPSFQGSLKERHLAGLIEFIKAQK